ncbi:MAG: DUF3147 family protein [Spirochaetia bacterium]|nr:DUF3147 family protein [Spirochaetia bacterium]
MMLLYIIKIVLSALLIVVVTEVSKRDNLMAAVLISIPWISMISILWIYFESKDAARVASFSTGVFWMVIPSLLFFIMLPWMLHRGVNFYISLISSTAAMTALYFGMNALLKKIGIVI